MIIHAYLLCYNEEKIIKNTLDYYSKFCSKIFVLDNMSTDKSCEIASQYENVTIIKWQNNGFIDESLYVSLKTQTYKNYSRKGGEFTSEVADWIISCDMDEILYHPDLISAIKEYDKLGVTVPCVTGFNVLGDKELNPDQDIIKQYSKAIRAKPFDKRILFRCDFDMTYSFGCHPKGHGFEHMKQTYGYKSSDDFPLALLHYKHIGERFYEAGEKNSPRVDPKKLWLSEKNTQLGPGSHYLNIQSGALKKITEDQGTQLFDENYSIRFKNFPRCTKDKGLHAEQAKSALAKTEVDFLRDLAVKLEREKAKYKDERIKLLELALRFRPDGQFIKNRLKKYLKCISSDKI